MDVPNLTDIKLETLDLGAQLEGDVCRFRVWAPKAKQIALRVGNRDRAMRPADWGYFELEIPAGAGDRDSGGSRRPLLLHRRRTEAGTGPGIAIPA